MLRASPGRLDRVKRCHRVGGCSHRSCRDAPLTLLWLTVGKGNIFKKWRDAMINEMCVAISSALAVPEKAVKLTVATMAA